MIRTGQQYKDSIRDGRQVWVNGERVNDVTAHPIKPSLHRGQHAFA
jgi:4-hydroxyphenylacetate 3-monooxygenase